MDGKGRAIDNILLKDYGGRRNEKRQRSTTFFVNGMAYP
jgi:hypothetical protein